MLLRFKIHELRVEGAGRCFLPLPKLTGAQLELLARHLRERNFSIRTGTGLRARRGSSEIAVDRVGLASSWSSSSGELLDAIAPAIPELLKLQKEPVLANPYFEIGKKGRRGVLAVRLFLRMESSTLWERLRGSGQCGLTPDEALVVQELLHDAEGEVDCVTDYPTEGCSRLQIGRLTYYDSRISIGELVANLRTLCSSPTQRRNCYLPKRSTLLIRTESQLSERLPEELGEWCFLSMSKNL